MKPGVVWLVVCGGVLAAPLAHAGPDWADRALARLKAGQQGLPPVTWPADNVPTAAKIALGRKLFFDRRLSYNGSMSCAMCHIPEHGFTNNELETAVGVEGRSGRRNSPGLINVAYMKYLFHDGRERALETQYFSPLLAHNEMANPSVGHVIGLLAALPDYTGPFQAAFGAGPSPDRMGAALASYQRTLVAAGSRFDAWHYGGKTDALSAGEQRGFALFAGKAGCARCHYIGKSSALFTDHKLHDTGYGWWREQLRQKKTPPVMVEVAPGVTYKLAGATVDSVGKPRAPDTGRFEITRVPSDRWRFRTPSLRNVALTGPYMHDGAMASLKAVVAFYNQGGKPHAGQDKRIRPLGLSAGDQSDLVAFLKALTSPHIAPLIADARSAPPDNDNLN